MDGFKDFLIDKALPALIGGVIAFISSYVIYCIKNRHSKNEKANDEQKEKIEALTAENSNLKNQIAFFEEVSPAEDGDYFFHKATGRDICPICWNDGKKISVIFENDIGRYKCQNCQNIGYYNHQKALEYKKHTLDNISRRNMKSSSFFKY